MFHIYCTRASTADAATVADSIVAEESGMKSVFEAESSREHVSGDKGDGDGLWDWKGGSRVVRDGDGGLMDCGDEGYCF